MGKREKIGPRLCLSKPFASDPKRIINSAPLKEHLEAERWVWVGPGPQMAVKACFFLEKAFMLKEVLVRLEE